MKKIDLIKNGLGQVKAFCDIPVLLDTCCPAEKVVVCEVSRCDIDCLWDELAYLYKYISSLEQQLFNHETDGHCPKILGPDKMQKVIDVLGLQDDYEVEKRKIYASDGSIKSHIFELIEKVSK